MNNRLLFLFLAMLLCLVSLFPTIGVAADATIDVSTSAFFKRDQDTMWRCYANVTIQNTYSENMTLMWVSVLYINATFVDGTSEQLTGLAGGNITLNPSIVLKPEDKCTLGVVATDSGFNKEPKIIWIYLTTSFFEISKPLASAFPLVPEFPSLLILPLSIIATLLAAIMCRKIRLQKSPIAKTTALCCPIFAQTVDGANARIKTECIYSILHNPYICEKCF
jgi:hypothetical protein